MTLLTGSTILSTLPTSDGCVSSAQSVNVCQGSLKLGHHIYHKGKGWLKQAARKKPMINLYSRLDMDAYKALELNHLKDRSKFHMEITLLTQEHPSVLEVEGI